MGAVAALAPGDPESEESGLVSLEEVLASEETSLQSTSPGSESYNPEESLDDIFSGLNGEDLSIDPAEESAGSGDADRAIGESDETQIVLGLAELVRLGEGIELSEAMISGLPGLGDTSLGDLIGLTEILDSRLAKSVYDHFGDAVDPPTVEGVLQALNESLNTLGDHEINVTSLEGSFASADNELRFDVAFTAARSGQLLLNAGETGSDQALPADYVATLKLDIRFGLDLDQQDGFFLLVRAFTLNLTVSTADNPAGSAGLREVRVDVVFDGAAGADGRMSLAELQAINAGELAPGLLVSGSLLEGEGANIAPIAPLALVSGLVAAEGEASESSLALDDGDSASSAATTNLSDLDLGPGDTTLVEIGGTTAGTQYDEIIVSGNANLAGTLDINLTGGFTPTPGDIFEVLTYGSATGAFATFEGLDLGNGLTFVPVQGPDSLFLLTVDLSVVAGLVTTIQNKLDEYIAGTQVGDIPLDFDAIDLGGFVQLLDLSVIFTGITHDTVAITGGSVTIEAGTAVFFPGQPLFAAASDGADGDLLAISGTYDPFAGTFSLGVDQLDVVVDGVFTANADTLTVTYDPAGGAGQTLVSIGSADVVFQVLDDTTATVSGLTIRKDGFSVANATVAAPDVSWAGVFELTSPTLTFTSLDYSATTQTLTGTVTIAASSVSLFEGLGAFTSTITGFSGSYNFGTEALSVTAATLDLDFGAVVVDAATVVFELDPAADTLLVSTGPSSLSVAGFVTVSGSFGFLREGGDIQVAATGVEATLGAGGFSAGITGGTFAMQLNADGTVALQADGAFTLTGGPFATAAATSVSVEYNDTGANIDTTISIGGVIAPLTVDDGAEIVNVIGLTVDIAGFVTLSGDLGFRISGGDIVATGNNVTARMEAGSSFVELRDAEFGLIAGGTTFAFEMKNGTLGVDLAPLAGITATDVLIQYTNATTTVTAGTPITVGGVPYTFDTAIAADVVALTLKGLDANILGFVSVRGDIGFRQEGADILAVGSGVRTRMALNSSVYVELSNADFGLISGASTFAFELSNGTLDIKLGPAFSITGGSVLVQFTGLTSAVTGTQTITVGGLDYTFDSAIADDTAAFAVIGLNAEVAGGVFTLSGDLGFEKIGPEILAVGHNVKVRLEITSSVYVELNSAKFGLISNLTDFAFELSEGVLDIKLGPVFTITGGTVLVQFGGPVSAVTGPRSITAAGLDYMFDGAIGDGVRVFAVDGLIADVASVFTLTGNLGFKKDGFGPTAEIMAVGLGVTVRMDAGPVFMELANADFGLISGLGKFVFELSNGSFTFTLGGFAGLSATGVFVQFSGVGPLVGNVITAGTPEATISVGGFDYIFTQDIKFNTAAFALTGINVNVAGVFTLTGDIGFSKVGAEIMAVGRGVTVRMDAGPVFMELANADFGLISGLGKFVFELSNGSLTIALGDFANITADEVFVQFSGAGPPVVNVITAGTPEATISVGPIDYIFTRNIEFNTTAFSVVNFNASVGGGILTINGDFGFSKSATLIKVVANGLTVRLAAGPVSAELVGADFGLIAGADASGAVFAFELKNGTFNLDIGPVGQLTVRSVFAQVTGPTTTITAGDTIVIGPAVYTFGSDISQGTIAFFIDGTLVLGPDINNGFSLDGTFTLEANVVAGSLEVATDTTLQARFGSSTIFSVAAVGALLINDNGMAGKIQVTFGAGFSAGGPTGFTFSGSFFLQFNTTSSFIGTIAGQAVNLEAGPFVRVRISGSLAMGGRSPHAERYFRPQHRFDQVYGCDQRVGVDLRRQS